MDEWGPIEDVRRGRYTVLTWCVRFKMYSLEGLG